MHSSPRLTRLRHVDSRASRTLALALAAASMPLGCGEKTSPKPDGSASAASWVEFKAADGSHRAKFFAEPKLETKEDGAQPSGIVLTTKSATASDDARLFVVSKLELSHVKTYDCEAGLGGMIKSSLGSMGCTPSGDQPMSIGGRVAHDVEFTCQKSPARGRMRVVCEPRDLANGRVDAYSVMALYQNELWNPEEAKVFVESFSVL